MTDRVSNAGRRAAAFPKLDESHLAALARCVASALTRYERGRTLIEVGQRGFRACSPHKGVP